MRCCQTKWRYAVRVRTTVTLDPDTEALVRRRMAERKVSFKQALNDAIRDGARGTRPRAPFRTATVPMGEPAVNLDKALTLAGELEDEALALKLRLGS
jgi:hypothetical protein